MLNLKHEDYSETVADVQKAITNQPIDTIVRKNTSRSLVQLPEILPQIPYETLKYPWLVNAKKILQQTFKKNNFLPSQLEAITAIMDGKDCLIVKSTGGGKSLCYQLPSLLTNGYCIVISPLLSLINDQIIKLNDLGISAISINSSMRKEDYKKLSNDLENQIINYKIIYITPEQYAYNWRLRKSIKMNSINGSLSFIAIDEIHCLKDWGETYRGTYKALKNLKKKIKCPVIGLTATANKNHLDYFEKNLILKKPVIIKSSILRNNLSYQSIWKEKDSLLQVYEIIKSRFSNQSGIVYCLSVKESKTLGDYLRNNGISATSYHGKLNRDERNQILQDWLDEKIKVIVGTNAFGMGIDKENVRFIIHHTISSRIADYVQETGRAGRDGLLSTCITLFNIYDVTRRIKLNIDKCEVIDDILQMIKFLYSKNCKKKVIACLFNETFDENKCKRECKLCKKDIDDIHGGSERLIDTILSDAKKILENSKENITQKKLSTALWKMRRHWSKDEIDMFLTSLIIKEKLIFKPQRSLETRQNYIEVSK